MSGSRRPRASLGLDRKGTNVMVPTINHWVGQDEAIRRFKVALEAAWNDAVRLPHMLLVGGPGLGKTLLAQLAAREMGVELHERLAQVVGTLALMNGLLLKADDKDIVFLDEIHELPPNVQTVLYRSMENQLISIQAQESQTLTMPLRDFTLVGATTDEFRLLAPLRDRFKVILPFVSYDADSLAAITRQRAALMGVDLDERLAMEISKRSKGTPRLAIRLLESCHRYARSKGDERITMKHFEQTVIIDQIDSLGLGPDEQRYLKFVGSRNGSPVRLFTIESATGVHRRTIQTVIEPFLVKTGLIERSPNGRTITQRGLEHLGLTTHVTSTTRTDE